MRLRRYGRTGLQVSECALGTAQLGRTGADPKEAAAAAALAFERGVNAVEVDAADGAAIAALGRILAPGEARRRVHVFARAASLVRFDLPSPHIPVQQAYPGAHLRMQVETLLARLGMERLGGLQLHAWCPEWLHEGDWLETLSALREEGKVASFGISLFDHDVDAGLEAAAGGAVDAVEAMYNIFDQGAAAALLPECRRNDLGVIVRSPLYYGMLAAAGARPTAFAPDDWREAFFFEDHLREAGARADRVEAETGPLPELALRFCVSHPAVSTVAVGMRTRAQVERNLEAIEKGPLDADTLRRLAGHKWLC